MNSTLEYPSENNDNDAVFEDGAAAETTTKPTQDDIKQFKFLIKNIQNFNVNSFDTTNTSDPYLKTTLGGNFKIEDERCNFIPRLMGGILAQNS
ncbi:MAG: hypothetical protein EZS28_005118 [Streblomastix strix]|uniref:Uncharacterized protein n=1 Tax=Streblomastix strix TaxID=222440 RepID=A0A5J4WWE2_9EUKA|nr:MAG: hypothetical protein EZS28_005118 [Streblomastix strix]